MKKGSSDCHQALSKIFFNYRCKTLFGQQIYVVGNTQELGKWNPTLALKLQTEQSTYPIWSVSILIPFNTIIKYKYFIVDSEGQIIWEELQKRNRSVLVKSAFMKIIDHENNLSTIIKDHNRKQVETSVTFNLKAETKFGEQIYILGSCFELGYWDFKYMIPLYTDSQSYPN